MINRRDALTLPGLAALATGTPARGARLSGATRGQATLADAAFQVELDPDTGGIVAICHPGDPAGMNWIGSADTAPWQPAGTQWGLGFAGLGSRYLHRARWSVPAERERIGAGRLHLRYRIGDLAVDVERWLADGGFHERYRFTNAGSEPLRLRSRGLQSFGIYTPFNDHYRSAEDAIEHRAHAHVWTGQASSWVAMLRMGGRAPHLGLVVTEGALDGYGIEDRNEVTSSDTRGSFVLFPAGDALAPGQSATVGWTLFWHRGWEDFFAQALRRSPRCVRIDASAWTATASEPVRLNITGALGPAPTLLDGDAPVPVVHTATGWQATLPPAKPGERPLTLRYGDGLTTRAVLNTVPDIDALIDARVRFIVARQQWRKQGDAWDGAFLVYDNELDAIARFEADQDPDRNGARERVGMGVLIARWLRQGKAQDAASRNALGRYYRFINARIQRPDGYVRDGPDSKVKRLYNCPWVMQLHVEMARLTGDAAPLDRFVRTVDSYYREGGAAFYAIGLPIAAGLAALKDAGMSAEHDRLLGLFADHGRTIMARGAAYPPFEVNFEQSIVAPAAITLLELHQATGERRWLDGARPHVDMLQLFEGRQPDHHLHGVAIRHWDGYWFGKARMWGDTMPHYWSTLNAIAWSHMDRATGDPSWRERAETTLRNNLSLFTPDGRGSAVFIYPTAVNGRAGHFADPYANDQDWALVHLLQVREMRSESTG